MINYESLKIQAIDHFEFAVGDLNTTADLFCRFGFEKVGVREIRDRKLRSYLLVQNEISLLLTSSGVLTDPIAQYVSAHGDGIYNVVFRCEDAVSAFEIATNRGAESANPPRAFKKDFGRVELASIKAFGDIRHTFLTRHGNLFTEGFDLCIVPQKSGFGLSRVDHFTCAIDAGQLDQWVSYYRDIFGLRSSPLPGGDSTNLATRTNVLASEDGKVKILINEPKIKGSPVQDFIDVHHGPGIQKLAFQSQNILASMVQLRKAGLRFIDIPRAYYENLISRTGEMAENLSELEASGIMVDGVRDAYLLQSYSEKLFGMFFCEIIQRKGSFGFGAANLEALIEAIRKNQAQRGVLTT